MASEMLEMGLVDGFILSLIEQVRLPLQVLWALVSMAGWLLQKSLQSLFSVSLLYLGHLPHDHLTGIFWRHIPQLSTSLAGKVCVHPAHATKSSYTNRTPPAKELQERAMPAPTS